MKDLNYDRDNREEKWQESRPKQTKMAQIIKIKS